MQPATPRSPHMRLRRWDFAGDGPELPQLSSRRRKPRGAKAMRDLQPLAEPSSRSLTERTLDAAQDWSVHSTPRGLEATCGLQLSDESRARFFGHRTGLDVEAELQRQAVLLKGLLRDVAIMRDTVWHLSDELAGVSAPQNDFEQLSAEVRELQRAFGSFSREEEAERGKLTSYQESRSLEETRFEEAQSFRELETRFEEHSRMLESRFEELNPSFRHLETRFEEHKSMLDTRFSEMQSLSRLEARLEEHGQMLETRFADHTSMLDARLEDLKLHKEDVQGLHQRMADLELFLRSEVSRQSLLQLSASVAEEVVEQASARATPLLRLRAQDQSRPSTSPARPGGAAGVELQWLLSDLLPQTHAERVAEVAAEMAREVVHAVLTNLEFQVRETPSPQP
ncbi:unnamed protein product [Symbiodinium pilosum]|uniref:Uncharacterized protein n=1 Tax=Symbiodinium pilosum TaxID=2952 RepID=A0A812QIV2_SYMPI|nr:unnamed protein product [Symbiodinium pilosum]